jgi:hypothetical protein
MKCFGPLSAIAVAVWVITQSQTHALTRGYLGYAHCRITGASGSAQATRAAAAREGLKVGCERCPRPAL